MSVCVCLCGKRYLCLRERRSSSSQSVSHSCPLLIVARIRLYGQPSEKTFSFQWLPCRAGVRKIMRTAEFIGLYACSCGLRGSPTQTPNMPRVSVDADGVPPARNISGAANSPRVHTACGIHGWLVLVNVLVGPIASHKHTLSLALSLSRSLA